MSQQTGSGGLPNLIYVNASSDQALGLQRFSQHWIRVGFWFQSFFFPVTFIYCLCGKDYFYFCEHPNMQ